MKTALFISLFAFGLLFPATNSADGSLLENSSIQRDTVEGPFIDSSEIGVKGMYKVEIKQTLYPDDRTFVQFKLYKKVSKRWTLGQTYELEKDPISSLGFIVADYNGDGLGDLSFKSNTAARMANVVRSLFIFNEDHLDTIKNATEYPNLQYNSKLNCLDSWMVYGGCSTVFLKLKNDSLKEFASVELYDALLTVREINSNGVETILLRRKMLPGEDFTRYVNYNPLTRCGRQKNP